MKSDSTPTSNGRKPYSTPVVTTFGSISKLTQSGVGTRTEGASGKTGKSNG